MRNFLYLALLSLSTVVLGSDASRMFGAVAESVRERREIQQVITQLGDPVEIEHLEGGIDRYHFDIKGRGVYVPTKGRWAGAVIDVKGGRCQSWDPALIHADISGPSGRSLGRLPHIKPLQAEDWKIVDVLGDFSLSAKLEHLGEEDRQFLLEYVKEWFALARQRREDPPLSVDTDFAKLVFALTKAQPKTLIKKDGQTVRLSELSEMLK